MTILAAFDVTLLLINSCTKDYSFLDAGKGSLEKGISKVPPN